MDNGTELSFTMGFTPHKKEVAHETIGGTQYIHNHPWAAIPYLILASALSVFGTAGNLTKLANP